MEGGMLPGKPRALHHMTALDVARGRSSTLLVISMQWKKVKFQALCLLLPCRVTLFARGSKQATPS